MAKKVLPDVCWVGVNAPTSPEFHGIASPEGGSYNSYLILDEQPTLVSATNKQFFEHYMTSLSSVIKPEELKYIVINHAEPDHVGALKEIFQACPNAKIVCTDKCHEFLQSELEFDFVYLSTNTQSTLKIGKRTLTFYPHPMIHWPETMMTHVDKENILFSEDLFSSELAHQEMFADRIPDFTEMTKEYYAMVMGPVKQSVKTALVKVKKINPDFIFPSHGPLYRKGIKQLIALFEKLVEKPEENKVLILYHSIWGSTEKMAQSVAEGVSHGKSKPVLLDVAKENLVTIMTEALTSKAIAIGSMTINNSYFPTFDSAFHLFALNNQKGKPVSIFSSHGWAPAAITKLQPKIDELEYKLLDTFDCRFGPKTKKDHDDLVAMGKKLALLKANTR